MTHLDAAPQRWGITGGIASGKSYVCRLLETQGAPIFYTDPEAKRIIRTDPQVQEQLRSLVGAEVYDAEGKLVKRVLAAYLCQGRDHSARVDAIVHPRVAAAWQDFVAAHHGAPRVFMECALLFESGFDRFVDRTLHVSCPDDERLRRLMARDGIDREAALRWMALQLPEAEKCRRAHHVLCNDGRTDLTAQLVRLGLVGD